MGTGEVGVVGMEGSGVERLTFGAVRRADQTSRLAGVSLPSSVSTTARLSGRQGLPADEQMDAETCRGGGGGA
ncbi:MAG: hypothetical protein ACRCYR_09665, partial [Phycicoccus sp.]